jgi:hypothetical protein
MIIPANPLINAPKKLFTTTRREPRPEPVVIPPRPVLIEATPRPADPRRRFVQPAVATRRTG